MFFNLSCLHYLLLALPPLSFFLSSSCLSSLPFFLLSFPSSPPPSSDYFSPYSFFFFSSSVFPLLLNFSFSLHLLFSSSTYLSNFSFCIPLLFFFNLSSLLFLFVITFDVLIFPLSPILWPIIYLISNLNNFDVGSIGGSVVEFSPATREARVRFPANATSFSVSLLCLSSLHLLYFFLFFISFSSFLLQPFPSFFLCVLLLFFFNLSFSFASS